MKRPALEALFTLDPDNISLKNLETRLATLKAYVSCLSFNLANNSNEMNAQTDKNINLNLE